MGNALVWLLIVPTVAAIVAAILGQQRASTVRWVSLGATVINLVLALTLAIAFAGPRMREAGQPLTTQRTFEPEISVATSEVKPV